MYQKHYLFLLSFAGGILTRMKYQYLIYILSVLSLVVFGSNTSEADADKTIKRLMEVHQITNQEVLAKIAEEDEDRNVRQAACSRITDQTLLAKLAVEGRDDLVRVNIIFKLDDQNLLAKLAAEDKNPNVRWRAASRLEELKADEINGKDRDIHEAVMDANEVFVKSLLSKGINVNTKGTNKNTPLHYAVMCSGDIVKLLVSSGADVNAKNRFGQTPLHIIASVYPSDKWDKNHIMETIKLLVEAGADLEAKNDEKKTPLWITAEKYPPGEAVDILLKFGANFENIDDMGLRLIAIPISYSDEELKAWLDKNIPDVNKKDKAGSPLLHKAVIGGKVKVIKELLSRSANVNAVNQEGQTALHLAACNPRPEIIDLLIQFHADVNARDNNGRTPLHYIPKSFSIGQEENIEMVIPKESMMLLFNHGAEMVDDNEGRSPLTQAKSWVPQTQNGRKYQSEMITFLSQHQNNLPAKTAAAQKELYNEDIYTRRKAAVDLYHMGDFSGVPVMIESLRYSEYPLTLSVANAVLRDITGNDFSEGKRLKHLPENQQKEAIKKWLKWWEDNKSAIKADPVDKDRLDKILKNDPFQRQQFFTQMAEKEKANPELPKFKDSSHTPQKTFETFMNAIQTGDDAKALSCLFYPVAEEYKPILSQFTKLQRRNFVEDMGKHLFFDANLGNMLSYKILVEDDERLFASPVNFAEDGDGNWIITGI